MNYKYMSNRLYKPQIYKPQFHTKHFTWNPFCLMTTGFSPEIFEGVVAISGVVKLGSITNVTQSAT